MRSILVECSVENYLKKGKILNFIVEKFNILTLIHAQLNLQGLLCIMNIFDFHYRF